MEINAAEFFTLMFGLTEAIGAIVLVLLIIWLGMFRGGFAWTYYPKNEFNWHPLLMTVSMIFLYGNAILAYRAFRTCRKRKLKIAHATINGVAFILAVIGLQAVFDSHNLATPPIENMYSLHSWLGITAVFLFACQWVVGLVMFFTPKLSAPLKACYYPIHVFFGICVFVCAAATALTGLTEKAIFSVVFYRFFLSSPTVLPDIMERERFITDFTDSDYSKFASEGILINFIGIAIIIFASLVVHLVTESRFKRQPLPEDEMLLTCTEKLELCQDNQLMCYAKPSASPNLTESSCQGDNLKNFNPDNFKSCELVLECFGEDEETLKIRIDHLHISSKNH